LQEETAKIYQFSKYNLDRTRPMWQRLSTVYAEGAKGAVHFFPGTTVSPQSIWLDTGKYILLNNGVNIITYY